MRLTDRYIKVMTSLDRQCRGQRSAAVRLVESYGGQVAGEEGADDSPEDSVAIPKANLLQIDVPAGTQPCDKFGVHPSFSYIKSLYVDNDAAFIANIGSLIEPLANSDEFYAKAKLIPSNLFGHNTQQKQSQSLHAQHEGAKGILGRIVGALMTQATPKRSFAYSIVGNKKIVQGAFPATMIDANTGIQKLKQYGTYGREFLAMSAREAKSVFAETYASQLEVSLQTSERLGKLMEDAPSLSENYPGSGLGKQLKQIATLVSIRHETESERDVFVAQIGGWDTHQDMTANVATLMRDVDRATEAFVREMKGMGLWEGITIVTVSDFGRTLTNNGLGTDHGWGGHMMLLGGGVNGGQILGQYPSDIRNSKQNPLNVGRGRMIPTTPWDGLWHGVAQWMDVDEAHMLDVLPNKDMFEAGSTLFTREQMFSN